MTPSIENVTINGLFVAELKKHPRKNVVRGHCEMEFFIFFIGRAKSVLNKALGKALKVHLG